MKVEIDSSEPLIDAIRVIGALYDVTLTETSAATGVPDQDGGLTVPRRSPRSNGKPATSTPTQPRRPAAQQSMPASAAVSRRKTAAKTADPGEIRTWAKANGHTVNERGPLPGTVRAAFAAAQRV
ncbi:MAG: histone-like nucleoid-structuring protein Lsr2 [Dermatophilaceae bacterium]